MNVDAGEERLIVSTDLVINKRFVDLTVFAS